MSFWRKFSSLAAPNVLTTFGAASDENFVTMTNYWSKWHHRWSAIICVFISMAPRKRAENSAWKQWSCASFALSHRCYDQGRCEIKIMRGHSGNLPPLWDECQRKQFLRYLTDVSLIMYGNMKSIFVFYHFSTSGSKMTHQCWDGIRGTYMHLIQFMAGIELTLWWRHINVM